MTQFFIDKDNKIPLYLQLKDQIKYFISTGAMTAKEQLPPVKILAKTLGINFLTVRKAYQELENEDIIACLNYAKLLMTGNIIKIAAW